MSKKIIVEIDENGKCTIDGQGFVGPECGKFVSEIENQLGQRIDSRNKPEYDERTRVPNRDSERSRG